MVTRSPTERQASFGAPPRSQDSQPGQLALQSAVPRGTTHSTAWPVHAAIRS